MDRGRYSTHIPHLPFDLKSLGLGNEIYPLVIAYVGMVVGSFCNKYSFTVYKKVTSKHEAVELLKRKLQEAPFIEWQISCGHPVPNGENDASKYLVSIIPGGCPSHAYWSGILWTLPGW